MPQGRLNWPSPSPNSPPLGDELAIAREFLDAVVAVIYEQHVVVLVEQDAGYTVELAVAVALLAPCGLDVAIAIIDGDALEEVVAEVEVVVGVEGERGGPYHLAGRAPVSAELPKELVLGGRICMPTMSSAVVLERLATKILPSERIAKSVGRWNPRPPWSGDEANGGNGLELETWLRLSYCELDSALVVVVYQKVQVCDKLSCVGYAVADIRFRHPAIVKVGVERLGDLEAAPQVLSAGRLF